MMHMIDFIAESNRIEGILRTPTKEEIIAHEKFLGLGAPTVQAMREFVSVIQPDAELRERAGMNVRIGRYFPPVGDITIKTRLEDILKDAACYGADPFAIHMRYERLHPFMDGNGRSGRALWLWMMGSVPPLGFLHTWYYQSLSSQYFQL